MAYQPRDIYGEVIRPLLDDDKTAICLRCSNCHLALPVLGRRPRTDELDNEHYIFVKPHKCPTEILRHARNIITVYFDRDSEYVKMGYESLTICTKCSTTGNGLLAFADHECKNKIVPY